MSQRLDSSVLLTPVVLRDIYAGIEPRGIRLEGDSEPHETGLTESGSVGIPVPALCADNR